MPFSADFRQLRWTPPFEVLLTFERNHFCLVGASLTSQAARMAHWKSSVGISLRPGSVVVPFRLDVSGLFEVVAI